LWAGLDVWTACPVRPDFSPMEQSCGVWAHYRAQSGLDLARWSLKLHWKHSETFALGPDAELA
jgi:hypothetical protein